MTVLDKSRDYATVMGDAGDGSRYVQDGKRFDAHGDEVTSIVVEEATVDVTEPEAITKATRPTKKKAFDDGI